MTLADGRRLQWHEFQAPLAFARRLARELPDATLHISDSRGHDVGYYRSDEIASVLSSYLR